MYCCKPKTLPTQELSQRATKYCSWETMFVVWTVCVSPYLLLLVADKEEVWQKFKPLPDYTAQQPRRQPSSSKTLLMSSVFGSSCRCEQLFSLTKSVISGTRTRRTGKHLEGCMRIATTEIKPVIERLLKQK
jgi:hypothetical protein